MCSTHFQNCRIPCLIPRPNFKLMHFYSFQTWMNGPCSQETSIFLAKTDGIMVSGCFVVLQRLVNPLTNHYHRLISFGGQNYHPPMNDMDGSHQGAHRLMQPAAMIRPKERDVKKSLAECLVTVTWKIIFRWITIIPNIPHVFVFRCFLNHVTFPRNCRN